MFLDSDNPGSVQDLFIWLLDFLPDAGWMSDTAQ